MGHVKWKSVFDHVQKYADSGPSQAQNIIWPLPSIHTFCSIQKFC